MHEIGTTRRFWSLRTGMRLPPRFPPGCLFPVCGASMPALPKPFFVLRASWHTGRIARRLNRPNTAGRSQQQTLTELLGNIALTAYGRDLGIQPGMSYDEFRGRVPVRDHD